LPEHYGGSGHLLRGRLLDVLLNDALVWSDGVGFGVRVQQ
jgi:hypothetical protein